MDGACWTGEFTFERCCYSTSNSCFDTDYTFERCCAQNIQHARGDVLAFARRWAPFTAVVSKLLLNGFCQLRRTRASTFDNSLSNFVRAVYNFLVSSARKICRNFRSTKQEPKSLDTSICNIRLHFWRNVAPLIRNILANVSEVEAFMGLDVIAASHTADLAVTSASFKEGGGGLDCAPNVEAQISAMMKFAWRRVRTLLLRYRLTGFEPCACAGEGYDIHMYTKHLIARVVPSQVEFPREFTDPTSITHQYIRSQRCRSPWEKEYGLGPEHSLVLIQSITRKVTCPGGDAASLFLSFHSCLLEARWEFAAGQMFKMLALVIMCPFSDSFESKIWGFSADDIIYNIARYFGGVDVDIDVDQEMDGHLAGPLAAQKSLAWRRSPSRIFRAVAEQRIETLDFPRDVCVVNGTIVVPVGVRVDVTLCDESGCEPPPVTWISSREWTALLSAVPPKRADQILFAFPFTYGAPNLWHALHWWVPSLSIKRARRWKRDRVHLALSFNNQGPGKGTIEFFSPILSIMSSHAPFILGPSFKAIPACFRQAVLGIPSFKYDLKLPSTTKADLTRFRSEMVAAFSARRMHPQPETEWESAEGRDLRVLVQLRVSGDRQIANVKSLLRELARVPRVAVKEVIMESLPFGTQAVLANRTDVLIGGHGAGLAWMTMMPPGSAVIEIMPELPGYIRCRGGWGQVETLFGGLANMCGHKYICVESLGASAPPAEMQHFTNFRYGTIHIPVNEIVELVSSIFRNGILPDPLDDGTGSVSA